MLRIFSTSCFVLASALTLSGQVTTNGFLNLPRTEAPGTLLSHPVTNGSEPIGRTTSINYLNGWIIVGAEQPGSRPGSDWQMRVYDIEDPENPVRRFPSDFGLAYPDDSWLFGNFGWNAHGSAQYGDLLLPDPVRVSQFGGLVERGGTNGIPQLSQLPVWYTRSSQSGPWNATLLWYFTPDSDITISRTELNPFGYAENRPLGTFDHVGPYGGGDWHPMFFGDLLIMARSGGAATDGVVVYRMTYQNMDDADPANDAVTPQFVGSLDAGFQGYWPNLFSDGTGLYVIGSTTDILIGADITQAADPAGDGSVTLAASIPVPGFTNASYPAYQDQFGFIHNRKVDMTLFLAGDANPIVLTLNEANPPRQPGAPALPPGAIAGVDTSQMSLPLGNLWLTGGYPIPGTNQGFGVWVHQQAPDTIAPFVSYHIPQANRTNYPRHAPLSFLLHEHSRAGGPRNGIDFTVRPVGAGDVLGSPVDGFLIHDFSGNLTFTPDAGLDADTTYQVDFLSDPTGEIGFRDAAGNYIEPYSFRFSTGGGLDAPALPVLTSLTADVYQPAPGQTVTVTASATGEAPLEYRFNFDGAWSGWGNDAFATHSYANEGRPRVLVQVRDANNQIVNGSVKLLVMTPPAGPRPTESSTLAVGDDGGTRRVWSVNPDADTVTVIDAVTGAKVAEHPVGVNPRGIARDANGRYWVTCHRSDEIWVLNADGSAHTTIPLDYGDAPFGVVASPDGQSVFVTMYGSAELHRYLAATPAAPPTVQNTFPTPRAIAVSGNGERVLVTRFISPELEAEIAEFAGTSVNLDFVRMMRLASANTLDGGDRAAGVPNYLAGIAISPDGTQAAVVSKQDNTLRGIGFGVSGLTHETTVRAVISILDLTTNTETAHTRRDFDNSDSPSAVTYTPLGDTILVAHQGNNRVVGIDALNLAPLPDQVVTGATLTSPALMTLDLGTGLAPQGVLIDPVSQRLFSQDFMGRSVTIRNAAPLLVQNRTTMPLIATTDAVGTELLAPAVLEGKQIFYNAADPRMSADSYISCATCHIDGGHDGRVWDFTGRGEGLRRTTDLRGRSGMGHGAVHWSGNFDEIQDFEHDIRGPFGGDGFLSLSPQEFAAQHPSPASGKTGLSSELDALAAYVASLVPEHTPRSPSRNPDGSLTAAAVSGQAVFAAQNCASCHSGDAFTNSTLTNVGTQSLLSGQRLGEVLPGIDTPTLHGLHDTRVYLHHGQASTLGEVFAYAGGAWLAASGGEFLTEINAGAVGVETDEPGQGGGGFRRGAVGGTYVEINNDAGATAAPGVRFTNVDGGASGGTVRISLRYVMQYGGGTAVVSVNGSDQVVGLLRQAPDNGWQVSGWQWFTMDAPLNAGATNTIEIRRGSRDVRLNGLLVANADDLAAAEPHRLVESLPANERGDLLAYLRQIDGRDASGTPLPPPPAASPQPPSIVSLPSEVTLAEGNALSLTVVVAGTGPFSFQWLHDGAPVGVDSPTHQVTSVQVSDGGTYTVTVTSAHGSVPSGPIEVTVNPPLSIDTTSLPTGTVGVPYASTLTATGGVSGRTWSLVSGVLPAGLSLSSDGEITGTPSVAARAQIVVRVGDSSGEATQPLTLGTTPVGGFVNDPDLILHYTFDEGSGTQVWDSSPEGNVHATEVPGAHWVADGRFGGAYGPSDTAAGLNRFFPANQGDLNFNPQGDAFTISAWVRTTFVGGYRTIVGKGSNPPSAQVQYRLWTANTMANLQGITGQAYGPTLPTAAPALNDGQWHLVTMVNRLDGATWRTRVYFDDGTVFNEFNTGAGGPVANLMRIGDTSFGGNGWNGQLDDLRIYRRALEPVEVAQLYAPPGSPVATLTRSPGQGASSNRPFVEFDITFSRAVSGLTVDDFALSGTAGHSASHLMTLMEGTHYRMRVAGFSQSGTVTLQLPSAAVTATDNAEPNPPSNLATVNYAPATSDDLAPLSDEFEDPATLADWQRNYQVEGWTNADKLEVWDIDTSRDGHMRLMPYSSSWYQPYTGALAFKEVTGDFVATLRLHANRRNGLPGRPTSLYSLAGIMVRSPRGFTNGAPAPDPGPAVVLPWPPGGGYTTPWTPTSEDYIFLSYGYADAAMWGNVADTWYNEVKTTDNGVSTLYATQTGIPANTDLVTLQVVRVGQVFAVLRRHGESGPWIVENRFTRTDMPATLQLGITTYTDWNTVNAMDPFHHNRTVHTGGNPDLVADADYFRLRRPDPSIDSAALQGLGITGQFGPAAYLADTPLAAVLGDSADQAYEPPGETYDDWLAAHLTPSQLVHPGQTDPAGDANDNGTPNGIAFVLGSDETAPVQIQRIGDTLRLTLTRNAGTRGATLIVESTTDLTDPMSWTPLATSINGADPTGSSNIQETGTTLRTLQIEVPAGTLPTFFRARVVME